MCAGNGQNSGRKKFDAIGKHLARLEAVFGNRGQLPPATVNWPGQLIMAPGVVIAPSVCRW